MTSSEFVYTKFYIKATVTERIPIKNIKRVKIGKTSIDRKITISLELYNNLHPLPLTYLTGFMTEKDKQILVNQLEKRIARRDYS